MELKQLVMLALQVSILATVFGFGLKATTADLLYLIRRPGLLLRSLVAVFVIMPALAVVLALVFDFPRPAEIVLISVAMSPVPPLLPQKETKAGGHASGRAGTDGDPVACLDRDRAGGGCDPGVLSSSGRWRWHPARLRSW